MNRQFGVTTASRICLNLPDKKPINVYGRLPVGAGSKGLVYRLLMINNPNDLTALLHTNLNQLAEVLTNPCYRTFHIPKKSGGVRTIHSPEKELKLIQKSLSAYLNYYYSLLTPQPAHGFVKCAYNGDKAKDILSNALPHVGKKVVLNIDLKNFFENISISRVYQLFRSPMFMYNDDTAKVLALLTTYQKHLPTGAPTSPVISNFVCLNLDKELSLFSLRNGLTYTRYADDLTFSSEGDISDILMLDIMALIDKNGFQVNDKKVRKQYFTQKQVVTGLLVNEKPNIVRKKMKLVRAMLYDWKTYSAELATMRHFRLNAFPQPEQIRHFIRRLGGMIAHIGYVRGKDDPLFRKYRTEYKALIDG